MHLIHLNFNNKVNLVQDPKHSMYHLNLFMFLYRFLLKKRLKKLENSLSLFKISWAAQREVKLHNLKNNKLNLSRMHLSFHQLLKFQSLHKKYSKSQRNAFLILIFNQLKFPIGIHLLGYGPQNKNGWQSDLHAYLLDHQVGNQQLVLLVKLKLPILLKEK